MTIIWSTIRCGFRITRLLLQFAIGIIKSSLLRMKYGSQWYYNDVGSETIQQWMQRVCRIIGLEVNKSGELFQNAPCLIVANHISWLDIIALASSLPSSFISKSELRKWPIIGFLAGNTGTIFINRNNRHELNSTINAITTSIKNGKSVILFPEGTTTNGNSIKRFKSALFQSAIDSNCNIQPITIQYRRNLNFDSIAPYINNDNFIFHIIKIMFQAKTKVNLYLNKEIIPNDKNRQTLTTLTQSTINSTLNLDTI